MPRFVQALLLLLARLTDRQLAAVAQYLKVENEILRSRLPKRVTVTPRRSSGCSSSAGQSAGRRRASSPSSRRGPFCVGSMVNCRGFGPPARRVGAPDGRRPARLVLRIAGETGWGYSRILGGAEEARPRHDLSVHRGQHPEGGRARPGPSGASTPGPSSGTIHAATLWQCDFFSHKVLTCAGGRTASSRPSSRSAAGGCSSARVPGRRTRCGSSSRPAPFSDTLVPSGRSRP